MISWSWSRPFRFIPDVAGDGATVEGNCFSGGSDSSIRSTRIFPTTLTLTDVVLKDNIFITSSGTSIDVDANDMVVQGNLFSPCDAAISVKGEDIVVKGNTFKGCSDEPMIIEGDNYKVIGNTWIGSDDSIEVEGNGGLIADNEISVVAGSCVEVDGNDVEINNNKMTGCQNDAIKYKGDKPTITNNIIESPLDDGIEIRCPATGCTWGTISGNKITGASEGDSVGCFDPVAGILTRSAVSQAINIGESGSNPVDNFLLENNIISESTYTAVKFYGSNSVMRGNTYSLSGTQQDSFPMLGLFGDGNVVELNAFVDSGYHAVTVEGDGNQIRKNTFTSSGRAAIQVNSASSGTVIEENDITHSMGPSILLQSGATGITLEDNVFEDNFLDICDESSGEATYRDNVFDNSDPIVTSCPAFF